MFFSITKSTASGNVKTRFLLSKAALVRDTPSHYALSFCDVSLIASVVFDLLLRQDFDL